MRDEWREDYDEGRGGWGQRIKEEESRSELQKNVYNDDIEIPTGDNHEHYGGGNYAGKRGREDDDDQAETSGYRRKK